MYKMNYRTDINFLGGALISKTRRALIREGRLFRKSYFLEGRLLESPRLLDHLRYPRSSGFQISPF